MRRPESVKNCAKPEKRFTSLCHPEEEAGGWTLPAQQGPRHDQRRKRKLRRNVARESERDAAHLTKERV